MSILHKAKEAFVPANQPKFFPTLHLIPETRYVRRIDRACNSPYYHPQPHPTPIKEPASNQNGFTARLKRRFHQYCADSWERLKSLGRRIVRWLVWRVLFPLSVLCAISVKFVNPAELPL